MEVQSYKDLIVWQKSMLMVKDIYRITQRFPREGIYGLTSQIRSAAVSIPSNIAEGQARAGRAEFPNFLSIARGSLAEVETQLLIAADLQYLTADDLSAVLSVHTEIGKMLNSLMNKLATSH
jgi:four helix bundle protein